jgi:hypothetical protein
MSKQRRVAACLDFLGYSNQPFGGPSFLRKIWSIWPTLNSFVAEWLGSATFDKLKLVENQSARMQLQL